MTTIKTKRMPTVLRLRHFARTTVGTTYVVDALTQAPRGALHTHGIPGASATSSPASGPLPRTPIRGGPLLRAATEHAAGTLKGIAVMLKVSANAAQADAASLRSALPHVIAR